MSLEVCYCDLLFFIGRELFLILNRSLEKQKWFFSSIEPKNPPWNLYLRALGLGDVYLTCMGWGGIRSHFSLFTVHPPLLTRSFLTFPLCLVIMTEVSGWGTKATFLTVFTEVKESLLTF